nr:ABC transporter substrate-binding protein [Chromobacterium sp. ASV5]
MRLEQQYALLYREFGERAAHPGLPALAALLACSERNARLQLAKMADRGWLAWRPGRGRGHRSELRLLLTPDEMALGDARRLVARGELEQAFARLNAPLRRQLLTRLPQLFAQDDDRSRLRMPIARPVHTLDPIKAYHRLEAHIVRQLFDCLCDFDAASQSLRPALAHHWEADADARRWRFWLRPGLRFHDGSPLDAAAVAASVLRLRDEDGPMRHMYRGLEAVETHHPLSLSFRLAHGDWLWPQRLYTVNAAIAPPARAADFDSHPVGCGAFRLQRHSPQRLVLEANPHYYRERPLLERIELWVLGGADSPSCFDLRQDAATRSPDDPLQSACTYLLPNPDGPFFAGDDARRRGLLRFLSQPTPLTAGDPEREPALGLLPGWRQPPVAADADTALPQGGALRLCTYDLASPPGLIRALEARLAGIGARLEVTRIAYPDFHRYRWWQQADLVLMSEVLHDDRDYGLYEWLGGNPGLRRSLPPGPRARLDADLLAIQQLPERAARMRAYQACADWLVREGWLLPLSHEREGLQAGDDIAGLRQGLSGWVDFRSLWRKD